MLTAPPQAQLCRESYSKDSLDYPRCTKFTLFSLVTQIHSTIMQRVTDIPASHGRLVKLASQLVDQLESSRMANEVFSSEHVRKALEKLIDLIIRTAREIEHCYSKPKWSTCAVTLLSEY